MRLLFNERLRGFETTAKSCVIRQYFDAVPLARFAPGPEERFLLHVGFPYGRKGVDLLLEAFARVSSEFPNRKLVLIGHELQSHIPVSPPNVVVMGRCAGASAMQLGSARQRSLVRPATLVT